VDILKHGGEPVRTVKQVCGEAISLLAGFGILLLLLAVLFVSLMTVFNSCSLHKDRVITEETREDGAYTVKLIQTGEPFLLSPVSAAVALYNERGKRIGYVTFGLGNDGGGVDADNLQSVEWGEESVTVTVKGWESDPEVYTIPYSKK
jgi:hypothetical protein